MGLITFLSSLKNFFLYRATTMVLLWSAREEICLRHTCNKVSVGTLCILPNLSESWWARVNLVEWLPGQEPRKRPGFVTWGLFSFIMSQEDVWSVWNTSLFWPGFSGPLFHSYITLISVSFSFGLTVVELSLFAQMWIASTWKDIFLQGYQTHVVSIVL